MNGARPGRSELATARELPHEHAGRPERRWGGAVPGYRVRCPVLVVTGPPGPGWVGPRAEGPAAAGALPSTPGRLEMTGGAGHYPHGHYPDQVVALMLSFLRPAARA
jgi:pimeloyl-ACP methyl ester carboxylesterase